MTAERDVLAALERAVQAEPDNRALRLHVAGLLVADGWHADALDHCATVLAAEPSNVTALDIAARAADAVGESARAAGYRQLVQALAGKPPDTVPDENGSDETGSEENGREAGVVRLRVVGSDPYEDAADVERPQITLADVGGMEQVKRRLTQAFLGPLRNPELRKLFGASLRGGLLLYGPPGCGKTFIARATAGELGARFMAVGLTDVLDMWLGQSERNLHELFETARRNGPCVLFLDEVDALGHRRSRQWGSGGRSVVSQLLAELDSFGSENEGVFVLAATNHPWDVDPALRRPGRLDRLLLVLPPDLAAREAILGYHLRDRPVVGIDLAWLAKRTDGWSGADLRHLCDSAAELALEDCLTTGQARPISMADCKNALREVRPTVEPWFQMARNHAEFGNEGGVYDDLLAYLRGRRLR
jgi:SpoVK/Ycf46/Vps4 family AAA+-type ATPase